MKDKNCAGKFIIKRRKLRVTEKIEINEGNYKVT